MKTEDQNLVSKYKDLKFSSQSTLNKWLKKTTAFIIHLNVMAGDVNKIWLDSEGEIINTDAHSTIYIGKFVKLSMLNEGSPIDIYNMLGSMRGKWITMGRFIPEKIERLKPNPKSINSQDLARIESVSHPLHGQRVNNCIVVRRDERGDFYFVTVLQNGNYGDKVLTPSKDVADCKRKIISSFKFWHGYAETIEIIDNLPLGHDENSFHKLVYLDYTGATKHTQILCR